MNMHGRVSALFDRIESLLSDPFKGKSALPDGTYFLDEKTILCLPRANGDSRYPYGTDGFYFWAYQSGCFAANESAFTVFPLADDGKQPYLAFFAGISDGAGEFVPVSLTGISARPREHAVRYTVFTPSAAYYLTEAYGFRFALRIAVGAKKRIEATLFAENGTDTEREIYLSSYINCLLKFAPAEDVETKWFKSCVATEDGFLFDSVIDLSRDRYINYYGAVKRRARGNVLGVSVTTSRAEFAGGKSVPINCAEPLFLGKFPQEKRACCFTDTAVAGEIVRFTVAAGASCEENLALSVTNDPAVRDRLLSSALKEGELDETVNRAERADGEKFASDGMLRFSFGPFRENRLNETVLNAFLHNVIRQTESCALAKTSSVSMLGIRDVFQQIEAALVWNAKDCRAKILEALSFIGTDGRAPRQYSLPASDDAVPLLDLRAFIDQGLWIIDALYSYLAYTGDDGILLEECGYYVYRGSRASRTVERGSVYEHLVRITEYLLSNLDPKTGCLRILYGDWNDAVDGLGLSADGSQEFGSGVSVMASLQLCNVLSEMAEILESRGLDLPRSARYRREYEALKAGLLKYAVHTNERGERRIVHGWGDNMSYFVGSFCDVDGVSRDGLASNAFWVISGAYRWDRTIKRAIMDGYARLDSKYGLKTFSPHFERGTTGVGRIPNLPRGTAENGATYVHATLFGVWSLFLLGEERAAWEQLFKILPQTHAHISTSPFVMSNSYVYNEEFGMDGESMNDWYTGSAAVLVKVLIRCVFGVAVSQTQLSVSPSAYFPCDSAEMRIRVRDCLVRVRYRNAGVGSRYFLVNGKRAEGTAFSAPTDGLAQSLELEFFD